MVRINESKRTLIVDRMKNGHKQVDVARELGLGQTSVRKVWQRYIDTGSTDDRHRTGRPRKTSERERRNICRQAKFTPFSSPRELFSKVHLGANISLRTVRRILAEGGLFGRCSARKPKLNRIQTKNRMNWCQAYKKFSIEDWKQIVFSDECLVQMFPNRRRFVRRPIGTRFCNRYVTQTVKFGGPSILVWGAIKGDGTRLLIKCPIRLDSVKYQMVLEEALCKIYDSESVFMQDGEPCHQSKSTMKYLENKKYVF